MEFKQKSLSGERYVSSDELLHACRKFADVLSSGQWHKQDNRVESIERSFVEVIGHSGSYSDDGQPISDVEICTNVAFRAEKECVDSDDTIGIKFEELYTIRSKVSQLIDYKDVPSKFFENLDEVIEIDDEDDDDDDDEYGASMANNPEYLQRVAFTREHEICYEIDQDGDICDYTFTIRYTADGEVIDEQEYSLGDDTGDQVYKATAFDKDKKALEWRSAGQKKLEESDIAILLESFEKTIERITDLEQFDKLKDRMYILQEEHQRRALGMIGLASSGFKGMKKI